MDGKVILISNKILLPKPRNGTQLTGYRYSKECEQDMLYLQPNIMKVLLFGNLILSPTKEKMLLLVEILLVTWPKV